MKNELIELGKKIAIAAIPIVATTIVEALKKPKTN
jgi:hypothetical protein